MAEECLGNEESKSATEETLSRNFATQKSIINGVISGRGGNSGPEDLFFHLKAHILRDIEKLRRIFQHLFLPNRVISSRM